MNLSLVFLLALLLPAACAKHRISIPVEPPEAASGEVSFKFLADKNSGGKQDSNGWEYHPPQLMGEAAMPSYPERPLARRFGSAVVIVKITISSSGEVTVVSPMQSSITGPFAIDFFQVVETAVRKWRFTRPEWWLLDGGKVINGDGKLRYQNVLEIKPASASGNVQFSFDLVAGEGKVRER